MTLKEQLDLIMKKARRSLDAAKRNFDAGDYDFASSRAYYAAFYAVEAILVTKELSFSKHIEAYLRQSRQNTPPFAAG